MKEYEIKCLEYVIDVISKKNNRELLFDNTEDINVLLSILNKVKPNPNLSEFPDFLSEDAILEHFSFTSSKDNRKGSSFKIEQNENENGIKEYIEGWQKNIVNQPFERNVLRTDSIEKEYSHFSHENFIYSLNKHLLSHIDSLKKYNVHNKKVIFLIEQQDAVLETYKNASFYHFYKMSEDKKALDTLKPYKELIDIIIFRALDRIEIIDMKNFDDVYKNSYTTEDIRGGRRREIKSLINLDIKF